MSRRTRKRYEQIHTRRAKLSFPTASKVSLHVDGTIKERSAARRAPRRSVGQDRSRMPQIRVETKRDMTIREYLGLLFAPRTRRELVIDTLLVGALVVVVALISYLYH